MEQKGGRNKTSCRQWLQSDSYISRNQKESGESGEISVVPEEYESVQLDCAQANA